VASLFDVYWPLDYAGEALTNGRPLHTLNFIDYFKGQRLGIVVESLLSTFWVMCFPIHLVAQYGQPGKLRCDNGPEYLP
jgi:putative transposase